MNVPFYYWLHECPYDYYRYTEFALRRFVKNSGMKLLELDPVGGMPEIMADVIAKNCTNIPKVGRFMAISVQWLTATFIQTTFGEWLSKATKKDFPIGYFLVIENYDGVKHIHLWLS